MGSQKDDEERWLVKALIEARSMRPSLQRVQGSGRYVSSSSVEAYGTPINLNAVRRKQANWATAFAAQSHKLDRPRAAYLVDGAGSLAELGHHDTFAAARIVPWKDTTKSCRLYLK